MLKKEWEFEQIKYKDLLLLKHRGDSIENVATQKVVDT
jgi:hypothetical protein